MEITNEAIGLVEPGDTIDLTSNLYFGIGSTILITVIAALITTRLVEPRLGAYDPALAGTDDEIQTTEPEPVVEVSKADEAKGLRWAGYGLLGVVALIALLTVPPAAPLRNPETGDIIGTSPFMDSLVVIISLAFLVAGLCYVDLIVPVARPRAAAAPPASRYRFRTDGATRAAPATRTCGSTKAGLDQPMPTVALVAKCAHAAIVWQAGVGRKRSWAGRPVRPATELSERVTPIDSNRLASGIAENESMRAVRPRRTSAARR